MLKIKKALVLAVSFFFFIHRTVAQTGDIDSSFGTNGKVTANLEHYLSIAAQKDAKIVIAGFVTSKNEQHYHFIVQRYNANGTPDSSFSGDGKDIPNFGTAGEIGRSAAIQRDGKIVAGGSSVNHLNADFSLVRYNSDGSYDTAFSRDGKKITDFGYDDLLKSVAIKSDGKIVAAGFNTTFKNSRNYYDFEIAQYNSDGSPDKSFSGDGKLIADYSDEDRLNAVAVQKDGKIVAAGTINGDVAVLRYNNDGSLDKTFSQDGMQTTDFGGGAEAYSIAIQNDGKIVAAGNRSYNDFIIARYNTDGSLDKSFSKDGKQTIHFEENENSYSYAYSVAIEGDGKILVAGYGLVRLNTDGSLDSTFSGNGKQTTDVIAGIAVVNDKLYAAGQIYRHPPIGVIESFLLGDISASPVVSLTAPNNNATYLAPAAHIKLRAAASDLDGTITKVEFYNGAALLHTETIVPYGYNWRDVSLGNYTLTAKAYDNSGNVTTSAPIHISVVPNKPPAVSIISPANNQTFADTATIRLIAAAADTDGRITRVEFYNATTLLRTEYKYPYTYNWTNVPAGTYTVTAVATDNWGAHTTSAPITVRVTSASAIVSNRPYSENNKTALNDALSLRLSPNPATNIVNIYTRGLQQNNLVTISIISVSGIVLKTMQIGNSSNQLDVSSLTSGVYTIKIISGNKVMYRQFVKL